MEVVSGMFQFLIGRVKMWKGVPEVSDIIEFQFLIGRVKIQGNSRRSILLQAFQFLIGRVNGMCQ